MAKQEIYRIYFHWTGTNYTWKEAGHYHTVIGDKGAISYLTPYNEKLPAHTFNRNSNSIALSLACMGGANPWKEYPPQPEQIESLCQEVVRIMRKQGWTFDKIDMAHMMTHAEAAANRDYPKELAKKVSGMRPISSVQEKEFDGIAQKLGMPHGNYGPTSWHDGWPSAGICIRWDLWQLKPSDLGGIGGFRLRERIKEIYVQKLGSVKK